MVLLKKKSQIAIHLIMYKYIGEWENFSPI